MSFVFEHPNYYSRYMDKRIQADFKVYTFWENMLWPPLFNKSRILDQLFHNETYAFTNEGWRRFGILIHKIFTSFVLNIIIKYMQVFGVKLEQSGNLGSV